MSIKSSSTPKSATAPTKAGVKTEASLTAEVEQAKPQKTVTRKVTRTSEGKSTKTVSDAIEKSVKAKKKHHTKVIRDSFSFPEIDYLKILQIKALCLSEGVHVKKGEVLRAGLHLLTQLNKDELKQVIGKVERVKTGRPLSVKP